MTIKKLKELIQDIPDDARVYLDRKPLELIDSEDEVIDVTHFADPYGKIVLLRTRDDLDVSAELEGFLTFCSEEDIDQYDAFLELGECGYVLKDFAYDPERYEWAKEFSETHSWEGR